MNFQKKKQKNIVTTRTRVGVVKVDVGNALSDLGRDNLEQLGEPLVGDLVVRRELRQIDDHIKRFAHCR